MRGRIQVHLKALIFSMSALCGVLFATFFFYDGPLEFPRIEPLAQATIPAAPAEAAELSPELANTAIPSVAEPSVGILPADFSPRWQQVSLDQNQVHLQLLKTPFTLAQTRHQAGSESFQYASYLFEQMAKGIHHPELAQKLEALSLQAQALGNSISQAEAFRFAGQPTANMNHLQVRSSILYYLSGLSTQPMVTARYNQHGKLLAQEAAAPTTVASTSAASPVRGGESLAAFQAQVDSILQHPQAKGYPQTMHLVKQESELLKNLASHLTLRWESTLDCHQTCGNVAVYLRVYTHQTLPPDTLATLPL